MTTYSNEQSKILYERAICSLAGGVGSMARGSGSGYQIPLYVTRGEGARIYDVDENEYLDYLLALGPLILGHRPPEVMAAVHKILDDSGPMLGLSSPLESEVAEMVQAAVPSAEMVRFSNSGTEAVMMAIRLARAYTGKEKIIRFEGCFHGWSDIINVSVKPPIAAAGLEHAPRPVPAAPGIPESLLSTLIIQPWNNPEILEKTVRERKHEIAAIITEPLMANCGCVEARPGYLAFLRQLASENGIVLIFDEVVTGFRLALGGAQEYYGVTPDLTTMAKAIGGGFPLSAVGGKREIMQLAADNRVPYLGTYNTNSVVMAAAKATLAGLRKPGTYERMHKLGDRLKAGLRDVFARAGITVSLLGPGTVFQLWFTDQPPQTWRQALAAARPEWYGAFQRALLKVGVLVHPSQYEHWFISTVHTEADVDQTLQAVEKAVAESKPLIKQ
ncbi:MAG: aspartate aminotransferase family protein [Anaerolineales bacterium]|nr:aspartate aminotransferase family protein [Anaerolineales bacterium]